MAINWSQNMSFFYCIWNIFFSLAALFTDFSCFCKPYAFICSANFLQHLPSNKLIYLFGVQSNQSTESSSTHSSGSKPWICRPVLFPLDFAPCWLLCCCCWREGKGQIQILLFILIACTSSGFQGVRKLLILWAASR